MKAVFYISVTTLFFCLGVHAQRAPEKGRSIYVNIKGPEESAAKLRTMFGDVALRNELFVAEDPHRAASKVNVSILQERTVERPLYAEVVAASLVSREGKSFPVYSCKRVTDGGGYATITTKSGKAHMPKDAPVKSTVWINKRDAGSDLVETVSREILNADFQLVAEEKDAEFTLKDIRVMKEQVRARVLEAKVESVLTPPNGSSMTLDSNIKSYLSIVEPISAEAEGCRDSLRHVADQGSLGYQQVADIDIAMIARQVK